MNTIEWKYATPQAHNNWKYASGLIAYTTITPFHFQGVIAGSEFLTYNAGKLYIINQIVTESLALLNGVPWIRCYDMANAVTNYLGSNSVFWDATAAAVKIISSTVTVKDFWFSRIEANQMTTIMLDGYRLNV
jgi:hypothetical protein